jgi:hypothetical protein
MLRWFLLHADALVGQSLGSIAALVYAVGFALCLATVVILWGGLWVDLATARHGIERVWFAECSRCGGRRRIRGTECSDCGSRLGLPLLLRLRMRVLKDDAPSRPRRILRTAFLAALTIAAALVVLEARAWAPENTLQRAFLGLLLASLAWLMSAVARLLRRGLRSPVRLVFLVLRSLAALGATSVAFVLADQSRPIPETPLATFSVAQDGAHVGTRTLPLDGSAISIEYVQFDAPTLGWHYVVPQALSGRGREPLPVDFTDRWIVEFLQARVDALQSRGLDIHTRADKRIVEAGSRYEVADVGGQVTIRKVAP